MINDIKNDNLFDGLKNKIISAIDKFIENNMPLLSNKVNERSISHKLAEYLQDIFCDWNVDCEYDKDGSTTKKLKGIAEKFDYKKTDRILPDIIIHQRNTNNNLVVIEIKTKAENIELDKEKLRMFTSKNNHYKYKLGLSIKFDQNGLREVTWFQNGSEVIL